MLYVRERLKYTALAVRDDTVERLWVRTDGTDSKADLVMGVYY